MVIAVNTRLLLADKTEGYGYFINEVFQVLTKQYSQHQFYFLFDRPYDKQFVFPNNVTPIVIRPSASRPILWKYWYDIKVPLVLKKIKADVFVSPDGFCSLTTKIPQCLIIHDLSFLHYTGAYKKNYLLFYKYYIPKFLKKAQTVATVSNFTKQDIIQHYKTDPDKISVIYSGVSTILKPLDWEQQDLIKERYTAGKEYFIFFNAVHHSYNLVNLLKAFSIFKKRQKSEMKMVLAERFAWKNKEFLQLLKTYKYKDDVILLNYLKETESAQLLGAAYALIYPFSSGAFAAPIVEAMKCNVPVLAIAHPSTQEIGKDAALYFDFSNITDTAEQMMLIYKDEVLRSKMIEKGKLIIEKYNWQQTADLLWQSITKAIIK